MSAREVADLFGWRSVATVHRWRKRGAWPGARRSPLTGRWEFPRAEVLASRGQPLDPPGKVAVEELPPVARRKKRWRVTARPPKGREGKFWQLRVFPPPGEGRPGREGKEFQKSTRSVDPTGQGATTEERAWALARAEEQALNSDSLRFDEVAVRYLRFRSSDGETRASSVQRYREQLQRFTRTLAGRDISRETVLLVQDELRQELAAVTLNHCIGIAGSAWNWAHERGLVEHAFPRPRRLRQKDTEKRPITEIEQRTIFEEMARYQDGRYFALFLVIAHTGCRSGEACALVGADIDHERREISFRNTKNVSRTVAVSPELLWELPKVEPDEHLFQRPRAGAMTSNAAYCVWRNVLKRAGLAGQPIDVHSMRRAWITDAHRAGVPLAESMRHTGHRTTRIHVAYMRNAPADEAHEVAAAVRNYRASRRSPAAPPSSRGGVLQPAATKEVIGVTQSGTSASSEPEPASALACSEITPTERDRLWSVLTRLATVGEDERRALTALGFDDELQRRARALPLPVYDSE